MSGNRELLIGQNLSLSCAYPEAISLRWERVGGPLASQAIQTNAGGNSSQLLLIPGVDENDSGQYLCRANTTDGHTTVSDAVYVAVLGERMRS